jgi:hypothetical protein
MLNLSNNVKNTMQRIGQLNPSDFQKQPAKFVYRTHCILKELCDTEWKEEDKGKKVDFLSVLAQCCVRFSRLG